MPLTSTELTHPPKRPPAKVLLIWASFPLWFIFVYIVLLHLVNAITTNIFRVSLASLVPKGSLALIWLSSHAIVWGGLLGVSPWLRRYFLLPPLVWFLVFVLILMSGITQGGIAHLFDLSAAAVPALPQK